jgi:hypothetical protein
VLRQIIFLTRTSGRNSLRASDFAFGGSQGDDDEKNQDVINFANLSRAKKKKNDDLKSERKESTMTLCDLYRIAENDSIDVNYFRMNQTV